MKIRYAAKTDVGMKRTHNEDYFSLIEDEQLFLVADGMGGHASGEVASKMAAETISEFYQRTKDEDATWPFKMDRSLSTSRTGWCAASSWPTCASSRPRAATSATRAWARPSSRAWSCGDKVYVGHVGDSRCYRVRGRRDHPAHPRPLAARGLQGSQARHDRGGRAQLPAQERHHPGPGHARDRAGRHPRPTRSSTGDVYVLCSDGLSGMVQRRRASASIVSATPSRSSARSPSWSIRPTATAAPTTSPRCCFSA